MQEKHQNDRKYGNTVDAELLHAFIGKQHVTTVQNLGTNFLNFHPWMRPSLHYLSSWIFSTVEERVLPKENPIQTWQEYANSTQKGHTTPESILLLGHCATFCVHPHIVDGFGNYILLNVLADFTNSL